jgi:hypothetical protein
LPAKRRETNTKNNKKYFEDFFFFRLFRVFRGLIFLLQDKFGKKAALPVENYRLNRQ